MGKYPITKKKFSFVENLMAFTAIEDDEIVGFFTMRKPSESFDELRFGFVVVGAILKFIPFFLHMSFYFWSPT